MVVIRRDPAGLATLPPRSCVPIPAALRHRCGLAPRETRFLLDRGPRRGHPDRVLARGVDQALAALIPFPAREGGDR